jgi:hypothetical protein
MVILRDGGTVLLWYKRDWWYRSCSIVIGNMVLKVMDSCVQCTCALCIVVKGIFFVITIDALCSVYCCKG